LKSKKPNIENEFREMQELFSNLVDEVVRIKSAIQNLKVENQNLNSVILNLQNQKSKTGNLKTEK